MHANEIFHLFDITKIYFLSCKHSLKHFKSGNQFYKTYPWNVLLSCTSVLLWLMTPIILNVNQVNKNTQMNVTVKKQNFFNLKYPLSPETYNLFFTEFYTMESLLVIYGVYCLFMFDLFFCSIVQNISNIYESLSYAYECLNFDDEEKNGEIIFQLEMLLSIVVEQYSVIC